MTYAKLIEGQLEFAPQNKGSIINYNANVELMIADGYKLFVEVERPETNRRYHIGYNETSSEIQEQIVYDETQEEADEREAQEEKERIGNLKCTKRVLVLMLQELQYSWKDTIKPLIYANDDAALEWELCVELERSNPLLDQLGAQLGISAEQIDNLFKYANGEITQQEFLGE